MTVGLLMQIDKLVQLIESPIFIRAQRRATRTRRPLTAAPRDAQTSACSCWSPTAIPSWSRASTGVCRAAERKAGLDTVAPDATRCNRLLMLLPQSPAFSALKTRCARLGCGFVFEAHASARRLESLTPLSAIVAPESKFAVSSDPEKAVKETKQLNFEQLLGAHVAHARLCAARVLTLLRTRRSVQGNPSTAQRAAQRRCTASGVCAPQLTLRTRLACSLPSAQPRAKAVGQAVTGRGRAPRLRPLCV
jgi:hypothetical protein